jgi:hypothetical protein
MERLWAKARQWPSLSAHGSASPCNKPPTTLRLKLHDQRAGFNPAFLLRGIDPGRILAEFAILQAYAAFESN